MLTMDQVLAEQARHQELVRQAEQQHRIDQAQAGRPSMIARLWTWISKQLSAAPAPTYKSEPAAPIRTVKQV